MHTKADAPLVGNRQAKIIATLGPSTDAADRVARMLAAGVDALRLNLIFGTPSVHLRRLEQARAAAEREGRPVAIIADIPGRKLRLGHLPDRILHLEPDQRVVFVPEQKKHPEAGQLPADQRLFHENMMRGDQILLADGQVELTVESVASDAIQARVVYGGDIIEQTGIHAPGLPLQGGPLTPDGQDFLRMAVEQAVDYLALTYVTDASDILQVQEQVREIGRDIPIIAKIERSEAFARLPAILDRAHAVMIRRGDLGADIEITRVPLVQREIMRVAKQRGIPVIVATQMLGSMIGSPRPTRAEASDVSNAIASGADGVLLSAETAIGEYPVESVEMMVRIIRETEEEKGLRKTVEPSTSTVMSIPEAVAGVACQAAHRVNAKLIACFTESGNTARLVAKYRPEAPIIAFCSSEETRRALTIHWGIRSDKMTIRATVDQMVADVEARLVGRGLVRRGDPVVIVFGAPVGVTGHTNSVRIHTVGTSLVSPVDVE
jgi:pyruvate kinase